MKAPKWHPLQGMQPEHLGTACPLEGACPAGKQSRILVELMRRQVPKQVPIHPVMDLEIGICIFAGEK